MALINLVVKDCFPVEDHKTIEEGYNYKIEIYSENN